MKQVIDLTGENFNRMDFCEARIMELLLPSDLPTSLEFTIYGAMILLEPYWEHDKSFLPDHIQKVDQCVSGIGVIKLSGLLGVYVKLYPYETKRTFKGETVFAKNQDGTDLVFKRKWGRKGGNRYLWECVMDWPYGFCSLEVFCSGTVEFEFDTKSLNRGEYNFEPAQLI